MCNCTEGKFERTDKSFAGHDLHPFAQTFLTARIGAVCAAPPVHDCAYVALRNQLSAVAWQEARDATQDIKDDKLREHRRDRLYLAGIRRMVIEHYATGLVG